METLRKGVNFLQHVTASERCRPIHDAVLYMSLYGGASEKCGDVKFVMLINGSLANGRIKCALGLYCQKFSYVGLSILSNSVSEGDMLYYLQYLNLLL